MFINFTLEEDCTRIRLKYHGTPTNAAIQELTKVELCNELDQNRLVKCAQRRPDPALIIILAKNEVLKYDSVAGS